MANKTKAQRRQHLWLQLSHGWGGFSLVKHMCNITTIDEEDLLSKRTKRNLSRIRGLLCSVECEVNENFHAGKKL